MTWCESRAAYRNFRLDWIARFEPLDVDFEIGETLSMAHYQLTELGIDDTA